MKKQFKIHCEFFIEAKDYDEAIEILSWETDFIESHVMVDEVSGIKQDDISNREYEK